jgi:dipeptidyl aminopeptidase/acylaminoacyl peptidase
MSSKIVPQMWLSGQELSEPRQSPDGQRVAWVVSWGSRRAIVVGNLTVGGPVMVVTSLPEPRPGRGLGGGCFDWLPDGSGIVFAATDGGLWRVGSHGGEASCLVPGESAGPIQSPTVSPDGSRVAYVVDMALIRCVSLADGAVAAAAVEAAFVTDPCWSPDGTTLLWQQWSPPAMAWDRSSIGRWRLAAGVVDELAAGLRNWRSPHGVAHLLDAPLASDDIQIQQPLITANGELWVLDDASGWLNVTVDGVRVVDEPHEHGGPTWGPGQCSYAVSPDGTQVAICRNEGGFGRLVVVDRASGEVRQLGRGVHGQLDWRGSAITALRSGARTPTQIVAYDAATAARTVLAVGPVGGFDDSNLVEPELVDWLADDAATIHGRLYRAADADGRLICWVHGGPTDQWMVTFLPRIAYWVQRGWTVLVPDHRGSTGHGRAYQQAMCGRWGELDSSDTAAGISAAHRNGWGTAERTVAMGSSAGGLTVLNLCRRGAPIAAAVALYPVSDLAALDATTHRFEAHYNATLVGTGDLAHQRYQERSPIGHVEALRTPLLIFHGTDDPVVAVEQSRRIAAAIEAGGGIVEFVEYPGEGHGFRQLDHQLDEVARTIEFLDRHVGGGRLSS